MKHKRKPVILLTGYLGAGKTTVMNELLRNQKEKKIAVIVNDMGSINVDGDLIKKGDSLKPDDKIIQLQNGCICCTLRDEFMEEIERLSQEDSIEAILAEASGISNPASIAEGFLIYEETHKRSLVYLSSIVSVVDADRILNEFLYQIEEKKNEDTEEDDPDIINLVMDQIEFCNLIILNKCDLLNKEELKLVKSVIRQIQPEAEMIESVQGKIDTEKIVNKKRFNYEKVQNSSAIQKALLREAKAEESDLDEYGISSFTFEEKRPFNNQLFMNFIDQNYPEGLIRAKGYIWFQDDDIHVHLFEQAGRNATVSEVSNWIASFEEEKRQEIFEQYPEVLEDWDEQYGDRMNQIVFIGKDYNQTKILEGLNNCLEESDKK